MINGGPSGTLSFNVPRLTMKSLPAAVYVMDILAADGNYVINLFPQTPASVTVLPGIVDITTLTGTTHP
jgi:hypothetical protein